jgi:predicted amidohydrolase YtcJ
MPKTGQSGCRLRNGRSTADKERSIKQAIFTDNAIVAVGRLGCDASNWKRTKVIDLGGKLVLPA